MDLFSHENDFNVLPYDGEVNYYGVIINQEQAEYFKQRFIKTIEWQHDELKIYGKRIITQRKAAWYGDKPYIYDYSNSTKQALDWTVELLEIKKIIEDISRQRFNSCLLNLYHNGNEGMSWHSDNEKVLGKTPIIASLSLGAERNFSFKHKKTKQTLSLNLQNGSLLLMKGSTQKYWMHCLPKTTKINEARINLTFRTFLEV